MLKSNHKFPLIVFFIIGFVCGIIATLQWEWLFFKIEDKVNLIDILSIVVTLGIAYWVSKVIEKSKTDYRSEKDLFIRRVEDINQRLIEFQKYIQGNDISLNEVTSFCKRNKVTLLGVDSNMKNQGYNCMDKVPIIIKEYGELNRLLTDTNVRSTNDPEVKVESGRLTYNGRRKARLQTQIEKMKNLLFELELKLNAQ